MLQKLLLHLNEEILKFYNNEYMMNYFLHFRKKQDCHKNQIFIFLNTILATFWGRSELFKNKRVSSQTQNLKIFN